MEGFQGASIAMYNVIVRILLPSIPANDETSCFLSWLALHMPVCMLIRKHDHTAAAPAQLMQHTANS